MTPSGRFAAALAVGAAVGVACSLPEWDPNAVVGCQPDAGHDCVVGICVAGQCVIPDGGCSSQYAVCNSPPGPCFETAGTCSPATNMCTYQVTAGATCSTACVTVGVCQSDGSCAGTLHDGGPCPGGVCLGAECVAFRYAPSNFDPSAVLAANPTMDGVVLDCIAAFDSSDGGASWCSGPAPAVTVVGQDGGPEVVVLSMRDLSITAGGILILMGSRPVIFAVWGDAVIEGAVVAAASLTDPPFIPPTGVGSNPAGLCSTAGAGTATASRGGGGGGGAYGTAGARGGNSNGAPGGLGGATNGNAAIIPLRGGCPGGDGARPTEAQPYVTGFGGSGGGAVQFSAARRLVLNGVITASGSGGQMGAGDGPGLWGNAGGGGGSGGAILFEGEQVEVQGAAIITANGGGGGGGTGSPSTSVGEEGTCSYSDDSQAPGGSASAGGGEGGEGGSSKGPGTTGAGVPDGGSGGGGGGVGRIRINFTASCSQAMDGGIVSPAATFSGPCP